MQRKSDERTYHVILQLKGRRGVPPVDRVRSRALRVCQLRPLGLLSSGGRTRLHLRGTALVRLSTAAARTRGRKSRPMVARVEHGFAPLLAHRRVGEAGRRLLARLLAATVTLAGRVLVLRVIPLVLVKPIHRLVAPCLLGRIRHEVPDLAGDAGEVLLLLLELLEADSLVLNQVAAEDHEGVRGTRDLGWRLVGVGVTTGALAGLRRRPDRRIEPEVGGRSEEVCKVLRGLDL